MCVEKAGGKAVAEDLEGERKRKETAFIVSRVILDW